ncbi:UNVERIFIED_CONTAM: hypothetical protein Sradi_4985300 [Sesamum radiatum]|uniref:Uncharacterized protein n=1 Tax=Sesamum radiatum TaxID=300843 RepID=A0AAW2MFV7_SESRA
MRRGSSQNKESKVVHPRCVHEEGSGPEHVAPNRNATDKPVPAGHPRGISPTCPGAQTHWLGTHVPPLPTTVPLGLLHKY